MHSPSREVWGHAPPGKFWFCTPEKGYMYMTQYGSKFTLLCAWHVSLWELTTNSMLVAMFPNLSILLNNTCWNCVCGMKLLPMKMIKTWLTNRLGESCLSYFMKIAMESTEKLWNDDLNKFIDIWNRKPRQIVVSIIATLIYHFISLFIIIFQIKIIWNLQGGRSCPNARPPLLKKPHYV